MMFQLDEYGKQSVSASSPSISSPDSHNSDSSIEIGDKRNSILNKHNKYVPKTHQKHYRPQQQSTLTMNKDLFLSLPFPMLPPPGFLPPTHFLFSNYHNVFYEQNHQLLQEGLLKTSDVSLSLSAKSATIINEDSRCDQSDDEVDIEKHCEDKRFAENLIHKRSNSSPDVTDGGDFCMNDSDEVLTPPRSPKLPKTLNHVGNIPIDLSMKSGNSNKSDSSFYSTKTIKTTDTFHLNSKSDSDFNDHITNNIYREMLHCQVLKEKNNRKHSRRSSGNESEEDDIHKSIQTIDKRSDEVEDCEQILKRRKSHITAPLDLTTKV